MIAAIEAALIHGQAQPWMYEVLALSMRVAGRPKAEVDRVLFSAVDFTAADFENMMYSAAYLTRFGSLKPALHLYRQTSRLQESRPEPYVMGLKLARQLNDDDAIAWAARGILTYAWMANHETLHRDAEAALLDAQQRLRQAGRTEEAERMAETLRSAKQRDLILKLTWSGDGDLDLFVEEPAGTVCSYAAPQSPGGGVLVHDGYGPGAKDCYEEYLCANGMPGNYRVRVRHAWGNIVGGRAQLTVTRYAGTDHEQSQTVTITLDRPEKVIRVPLPDGRRAELLPLLPRQPVAAARGNARKSLLQLLGPLDRGGRAAAADFARSRQRLGGPGHPGYTPIITVIAEGAMMSAMAAVSGDRRYVRLSVNPTFNNITNVLNFTFQTAPGQPPGGQTGGGGATQQ